MRETRAVIELLRHGEPKGGHRVRGRIDDPLSEQGWTQMQRAVEQRQVVEAGLGLGERTATVELELRARAQVDHVVDPQRVPEGGHAHRGQVMEAVGAEELAPAQAAAVGGGIAPEIAEVVAALDLEPALHANAPCSRRRPRGRGPTREAGAYYIAGRSAQNRRPS